MPAGKSPLRTGEEPAVARAIKGLELALQDIVHDWLARSDTGSPCAGYNDIPGNAPSHSNDGVRIRFQPYRLPFLVSERGEVVQQDAAMPCADQSCGFQLLQCSPDALTGNADEFAQLSV